MRTRIGPAGARVAVWYDGRDTEAWHWEADATGGRRSREAGWPTLADCVADAQRHLGCELVEAAGEKRPMTAPLPKRLYRIRFRRSPNAKPVTFSVRALSRALAEAMARTCWGADIAIIPSKSTRP